MLYKEKMPSIVRLEKKNSQPRNFLQASEKQMSNLQLKNMETVISSLKSVGILEISNMKINTSEWIQVFKKLCEKMLDQNKSNLNKLPQTVSYLKSLSLINNRKSIIIKQIQFLSFPYLTRLCLDGNKIQSIEGLQFMYMSCLRQLFLYRNFIKSFKPLERCSFPELYFVSVYDNFGMNFEKMSRMKHQVSRYWIETENFRVQGQDISTVVKFPGKKTKLTELGIKSKQRILQFKVFDVIRQQNNGIKIFYDMHRQLIGEQNEQNDRQY